MQCKIFDFIHSIKNCSDNNNIQNFTKIKKLHIVRMKILKHI